MGKILTNDEIGVRLTIPAPLTGQHWHDYWYIRNEGSRLYDDDLSTVYRASLAVIEHGALVDGDEETDLIEAGLSVKPFVMAWVGEVVSLAVAESIVIPKASGDKSSPTPSEKKTPANPKP